MNTKFKKKEVNGEKGKTALILLLSLVETAVVKEQGMLCLKRLFSCIIKDVHGWPSN